MSSAGGSLLSIGLPDAVIRRALLHLQHDGTVTGTHPGLSARSAGTILSLYANSARRRKTRRLRDSGLVTPGGGPNARRRADAAFCSSREEYRVSVTL